MNKQNRVATFPESAVDTACAWVAKLDRGELTGAEGDEFRKWLDQHPTHRELFATQMREWSDMDVLRELSYIGLEEQHRVRNSRARKTWLSSRPLVYAGGLFALVMAVYLVSRNDVVPGTFALPTENRNVVDMEINTSIGEKRSESLPDGSVVHINTLSAAEISYSQQERAIYLRAGEAFFDVAKEDRPFVVYADGTRVRAVGTAFSVYIHDGSVKVAVTEGTVEFDSANTTTIVSAIAQGNNVQTGGKVAGNVAIFSGEHITVDFQPDDVLARSLSWQDGMLEFRGETLEYAVNQLSRYTKARIVIIDDDIKNVRVGGYFKIGDIDGLASTLKLGFDVHLEVVSDNLIQLSRADGNTRPST